MPIEDMLEFAASTKKNQVVRLVLFGIKGELLLLPFGEKNRNDFSSAFPFTFGFFIRQMCFSTFL